MNDSPLWAVQENLGSGSDPQALEAACHRFGYPYLPVRVVPFSEEAPDVPDDRPVIFYGSARLTQTVRRLGKWTPGVFWEETLFRFSTSLRQYGAHMLNASARVTTMGEFAEQPLSDDREFFIRPDRDLKEFAGGIVTFGEFRRWCERLRPGGFEIDLSLPIVVANPVQVEEEWRLFIADQRAITGSRYRRDDELSVSPEVPDEVVQFATRMSRVWSPARVFVMDVARLGNELRIIETNGFNSAGFYASDVEVIVQVVSRLRWR